jgi:16S rRNA (cytosine(967)-C(5))-methyltransferase
MYTFRDYHTIEILKKFEQSKSPLDLVLRNYFKDHKALGSKDRNFIGNNVYYIIRNLSLIDYYLKSPKTWEKRVEILNELPKKDHSHLPLPILYSIPSWLFDLLATQYTEDVLKEVLYNSLTEAPLTIRVNSLKTSLLELKEKLDQKYKSQVCEKAPLGIRFFKREPVTSDPLYKEGLFEIQDEASQLAAELIETKSGDHILDYCAGAGGKALAIAPKMNNKGVLYIHDIRSNAVAEAKKRCQRAGVQNVQFFDLSKPLPTTLQSKMDWIFVDAPCSGTGTLRRNPDLKWKLSPKDLTNLVEEQRMIFEKALRFLKPGGTIIYATCSILKNENQDQVDYFIKKHHLRRKNDDLVLLPVQGGHDGFFASTLMLDDKDKK